MKLPKKAKTKDIHTLVFGFIFLVFICFTVYKLADGVVLNPGNITIHTSIVYYDHQFSSNYTVLDTNSALYFLNQSNENIYATIFEYDKYYKEVKSVITISPGQNQYIKTNGAGVVYLQNQDKSATSVTEFSRWTYPKKYQLPDNFSF